MPEYIYLLENRLTPPQKHALLQVRDVAREAGMTVFLAGGAVRDLTTGSSVRNFDFAVQGNALELEGALRGRGGELWGSDEATRTLTFWFPGGVLVNVAATRSEEYPQPGKPVYTWSAITDDLRRRDFTANAMALSLNEGSYGLLLDPLNGIADIEARVLRLGSNYGFYEDPSRLIRAVRLRHRLGWQLEERTEQRYANAKEADAIAALAPALRGYELEKVASEEDALGTLKALEAEGWATHLDSGWSSEKADVAGLEALRKQWIQLLMQGVSADLTAAHLQLLTARMSPAEVAELKAKLVHPGLLRHWESLDEDAKEFAKTLTGKNAATASASWKLLTTSPAEPILWLAYTRKGGSGVEQKLKQFFSVWPEFRKKVPTTLMQEMRITPELPDYKELLEKLFLEMIDGKLTTDEELRAFLEPFSPPAPPPPPTLRRTRGKKGEGKGRRKAVLDDDEEEEGAAASAGDEDEDDEEEEADEVHELDSVFARLGSGDGLTLRGVVDEEDAGKDEEAERDAAAAAGGGESRAADDEAEEADEDEPEQMDEEPVAAPVRGTAKSTPAKAAKAASDAPAVKPAAPAEPEPPKQKATPAPARPPAPAAKPVAVPPAAVAQPAKSVAPAKKAAPVKAAAPVPAPKKGAVAAKAPVKGTKAVAPPPPVAKKKQGSVAAAPAKKGAPAKKSAVKVAAPAKKAAPAKAKGAAKRR